MNGIYIPNDDYFAGDFLPDEWLPLIPDATKYKKCEGASPPDSAMLPKSGRTFGRTRNSGSGNGGSRESSSAQRNTYEEQQ